MWNVHSVLNVLHSLVDKSNINKQLEVYNNQGNQDQMAGDLGRHSLYNMLDYFSLVSLLRLHALLGDFYQSIKNYQNDQINKQTDQMYVLLSLYLTLHFQRIDESLHTTLRNKNYSEKMNKMQRGELPEFEACFSFSCTKFLSPVPPAYDMTDLEGDALHKEPLRLQLKVFMDEVQQQLMLPTIRSYLKLYTTMPLDKMAGFMEMPTEEFRNHLLAFKHKIKNVV